MSSNSVRVWSEPVVMPTYEPLPPERHPMFLERRVYQGSSGRVYPLPFYSRIEETLSDRAWEAIHLENEYLYVMILPEIGGRIHVMRDKTNDYDVIYRQDTIKPALVGLAGPWISGGIEFNWPQHHRPATYMPTEVSIEHDADGSVTVWLSDHDPMARMKGMHGVCLRPGVSRLEVKVRLYNRTPMVQTFLWWANVATRVHERYQSFFPPDVHTVADHAKRATSSYPRCDDRYYGVDYASRGLHGVPAEEMPSRWVPGGEYPADDLSWYANIPVPTSYMCTGTRDDFFGGYDHAREAGLVHVADHTISPGKKQWTWGNHEFGYAWDRLLGSDEGPYIELMAGVYTDNQPDFSFLQPYETKAFTQYWYPIQKIGPAVAANESFAVSLRYEGDSCLVGVASVRAVSGARIVVECLGEVVWEWTVDLAPDRPFLGSVAAAEGMGVRVFDSAGGSTLATPSPCPPPDAGTLTPLPPSPVTSHTGEGEPEAGSSSPTPSPSEWRRGPESPLSALAERGFGGEDPETLRPATEPLAPGDMASSDELYVTGLHLEQYRHATRSPLPYWEEALRRDPGDSRCNNAIGRVRMLRGEFGEAEACFRRAISRLTLRNPNPYDGEPFYNLGLVLRRLNRDAEAYEAFGKAAWNEGWKVAAWLQMAQISSCRYDYADALARLDAILRRDQECLQARDLKAMISKDAAWNEATLEIDPLDAWALWISGKSPRDPQVALDLAEDLSASGFLEDALEILKEAASRKPSDGSLPLLHYHMAFLLNRLGRDPSLSLSEARTADPSWCFPARLSDIAVLERAGDARAAFYLGNLLYDRRRYDDAVLAWERAVREEPSNAVAWRNLGIAYFNKQERVTEASQAYDRAFSLAPTDGRIFYERDQLWKKLGVQPFARIVELERHRDLVDQRDDLSLEYCGLLNLLGHADQALAILEKRRFQPWEGGEGVALGEWTRAHLILGRAALVDHPEVAEAHARAALNPPHSLGECRHLLANASEVWLLLGDALGDSEEGRKWWTRAAEFRGDFQDMAVRPYSDLTLFSALALQRLGRNDEAAVLLEGLRQYAVELRGTLAEIDYFATSLPTMLLFEDDLDARQSLTADLLLAQVEFGRGNLAAAEAGVRGLLENDPNHARAMDLLRYIR